MRLSNVLFVLPPAALEPCGEDHGAKDPVAAHREPDPEHAEAETPAQEEAQADPAGPHRENRDQHREFRVVSRAQAVWQGEGRGPEDHGQEAVQNQKLDRKRHRRLRQLEDADDRPDEQDHHGVEGPDGQIGKLGQAQGVAVGLFKVARADALADHRDHRQADRRAWDDLDHCNAVGDGVRGDRHRPE